MNGKKSEKDGKHPCAQPHPEYTQGIPDLGAHRERAEVELFRYLLVTHMEVAAHFKNEAHLCGEGCYFLLYKADQLFFPELFFGDVFSAVNKILQGADVSILYFLVADNVKQAVSYGGVKVGGEIVADINGLPVIPEMDEDVLHHITHLFPFRKAPVGVAVKDALVTFVDLVQGSFIIHLQHA